MKRLLTIVLFFLLFLLNISAQNKFPKVSDLGMMRAVHVQGNYSLNVNNIKNPSQEYINFLKKINANWVGIGVSLPLTSSMDSIVSRKYSDVEIPTFADNDLRNFIRILKSNGFNVYVTLVFQAQSSLTTSFPFDRMMLGCPTVDKINFLDFKVLQENWPWSPSHPLHKRFIKKFWETYTQEAIYYAKMCQEESVGIFSLGTETDFLFTTRTSGIFSTEYKKELKAMVDSVKKVYQGLVSYDQCYIVDEQPELYPTGKYLWKDIGFDFIGVSAYYHLSDKNPTSVLSVDELKNLWDGVFTKYLIPKKNENPSLPMIFLEFGYMDDIRAPYEPTYNDYCTKQSTDKNGNGIDDGAESQANIYSAFYATNEKHGKIIQGTFLWGLEISSDADWKDFYKNRNHLGFRGTISEDTIRSIYSRYINPKNGGIPDNPIAKVGSRLSESDFTASWDAVGNAQGYKIDVATNNSFTNILTGYNNKDLGNVVDYAIIGLKSNTQYYYRVRSYNSLGSSENSNVVSTSTLLSIPKASELGMMRAINMTGNSLKNVPNIKAPSQEYFDWLHKLNVNWVAIPVALHIEDSMDSTVERKYSGVMVPTFDDQDLRNIIRKFRDNRFNVTLILNIDDSESSNATKHVARYQLGDPNIHKITGTNILPEDWPWRIDHPKHNSFIKKFFETYTQQAIYYAKICNEESVGMFSLGSETTTLFRTRTGGYWPDNYKNELKAMVDSVRKIYTGSITYQQSPNAWQSASYYSPAVEYLWDDLGLDVIGFSSIGLKITDTAPTKVLTTNELKTAWESVFTKYINPTQKANPTKPILFLEFGYSDDIGSPSNSWNNYGVTKTFKDLNGNGLDDGEETQSNIYSSYYSTNEKYGNPIQATFSTGECIAGDKEWADFSKNKTFFTIRGKLAEETVKTAYLNYSQITDVKEVNNSTPERFSLAQNYPNPFNPTTTIKYELPENSFVTVKIFDVLGKEVATLFNGNETAGTHQVNFDGKNLPSGMYIYKVQAGNYVQIKKMILMK